MFSDDLNDNWDSTKNQDAFIQEYFGKTANIVPEGHKRKFKQEKSYEELSGFKDNLLKCEGTKSNNSLSKSNFTNCDMKPSRKKIKKSDDLSQDLNTFHESNKINDSQIVDLNCKKSKKERKKSKKKTNEHLDKDTDKINDAYDSDLNHKNLTETAVHSTANNNLLKNKFYQKLQPAKFRCLNEMLYTNTGKEALSYFQQNTDEFQDYHAGYQSQVSKWPVNPVDIIIEEIEQMDKELIIADLGCGEAKIAETFPERTVHSFDLIAVKDCVTACDIAKVPLPNNSVDIAVFCLSLMGTNWKDYISESHRIMKLGAVLKIAEIESRIEQLEHFVQKIESYGFSLENKNLSHKMFIFLNFKKAKRKKKISKVPDITLKPCLYKKR